METISWNDALHDLRRFVPVELDYGSPDRLWVAANALAGPADIRALPKWEELEDLEILERLNDGYPPPLGLVIAVTDHMFSSGKTPTRLRADQLGEFVGGYLAETGVSFFDGDVILLATDAGRLTIFHHEGVFAHWKLGNSFRTMS